MLKYQQRSKKEPLQKTKGSVFLMKVFGGVEFSISNYPEVLSTTIDGNTGLDSGATRCTERSSSVQKGSVSKVLTRVGLNLSKVKRKTGSGAKFKRESQRSARVRAAKVHQVRIFGRLATLAT